MMLHSYGGIFERGSREYTLDDFYSLQLDKMERYVCLKKSDVVIPEGEVESSSDDDDEDDDDDDTEGDDDDDDGELDGAETLVDAEESDEESLKGVSKTTKKREAKDQPELLEAVVETAGEEVMDEEEQVFLIDLMNKGTWTYHLSSLE